MKSLVEQLAEAGCASNPLISRLAETVAVDTLAVMIYVGGSDHREIAYNPPEQVTGDHPHCHPHYHRCYYAQWWSHG